MIGTLTSLSPLYVIFRSNGRTVFRHNRFLRYFITLVLVFIGTICAPTLAMMLTLQENPSLEVSCERMEPETINCLVLKKPILPFLRISGATYSGIKGVEYALQKEQVKDSEGDLVESTHEYVIFHQTTGSNKVDYGFHSRLLVDQIDSFLKSGEESLSFSSSANLEKPLVYGVFAIVIMGIGCHVLCSVIAIEIFDINYPYCLIRTRIGLPWYRKVIPLSEVQRIGVDEYEASEGRVKYYQLELTINHKGNTKVVSICATTDLKKILHLSQTLSQLMRVPQEIPQYLRSSTN